MFALQSAIKQRNLRGNEQSVHVFSMEARDEFSGDGRFAALPDRLLCGLRHPPDGPDGPPSLQRSLHDGDPQHLVSKQNWLLTLVA